MAAEEPAKSWQRRQHGRRALTVQARPGMLTWDASGRTMRGLEGRQARTVRGGVGAERRRLGACGQQQ